MLKLSMNGQAIATWRIWLLMVCFAILVKYSLSFFHHTAHIIYSLLMLLAWSL